MVLSSFALRLSQAYSSSEGQSIFSGLVHVPANSKDRARTFKLMFFRYRTNVIKTGFNFTCLTSVRGLTCGARFLDVDP